MGLLIDAVHLVNLLSEMFRGQVALQLETRGDHFRVFFYEFLSAKVDFLRAFESIKLILGCQLVDTLQDHFFNLVRVTNLIYILLRVVQLT